MRQMHRNRSKTYICYGIGATLILISIGCFLVGACFALSNMISITPRWRSTELSDLSQWTDLSEPRHLRSLKNVGVAIRSRRDRENKSRVTHSKSNP